MSERLSSIQIAMITSHTIRRFLRNFQPHERTLEIEQTLVRTKKFLMQRQRINLREFIYCEKLETALYENACASFSGDTPVFALDFTVRLYGYYEAPLKRHVNITPKMMEKIDLSATKRVVDRSKEYEIESNSSDLLDEYIKQLEPLTGVKLKKSAFAGKKLTIKNNMILDGKEVASGF